MGFKDINKEHKKQITLIIISFILIGIGCLNFKENQIIEVSAESDTQNELSLGDVQLVNSEPINEENYIAGIVPNDEINENEDTNLEEENNNQNEINLSETTEISINQNNEQYFTETKLERDRMYSETIEIYQKMLENSDVSAEQKAIAAQEISNIMNIKNGIMISENLIKNKGFENSVILVNNGIVSVIVKSSLLTQEQVAKIQNIVSRELSIDVKNINISNK